jgi:predicted branched-subunit amino acid permease
MTFSTFFFRCSAAVRPLSALCRRRLYTFSVACRASCRWRSISHRVSACAIPSAEFVCVLYVPRARVLPSVLCRFMYLVHVCCHLCSVVCALPPAVCGRLLSFPSALPLVLQLPPLFCVLFLLCSRAVFVCALLPTATLLRLAIVARVHVLPPACVCLFCSAYPELEQAYALLSSVYML